MPCRLWKKLLRTNALVHTGRNLLILYALTAAPGGVAQAADPVRAVPPPVDPGPLVAEWKQQERDLHQAEAEAKAQARSQGRIFDDSLFADVAVYQRCVEWAVRYEPAWQQADADLVRRTLQRGANRLRHYRGGDFSWTKQTGRVVRGYRSRLDDSIQPYGLHIPADYDAGQPHRLDVVLHGSMGPAGINEVRFLRSFDEPAATAKPPQYFELHPLGRMENCYRWSGETDVFEAIDDVCRKYSIDRDRIVLRGMSMGASGTWHLGLKHPDRFVALGPYCGYVDTHRMSQTPIARFPVVGPLPAHQELGLHLLDSKDYAANAGVVPAIACMGDQDIFFEAHEIMRRAMRKEGLEMVNLISPGTGHVIDPVTFAEQMRRIAEYSRRGLNHNPARIRFVTWSLKYARCHWLQVQGLEQHYAKAEIDARQTGDEIEITTLRNINRFAITAPAWRGTATRVRILEELVPLTTPDGKPAPVSPREGVFVRRAHRWVFAGETSEPASRVVKRPGLQGPIDDAFTTPFLCVRGTGTPWNPAVQKYADAALDRFSAEWHQYFRGTLPVKRDTEVTEADVRDRHLILFGDPGSNSWMARLLPGLPVEWSREKLNFAGESYPAANHLLSCIYPNPLPGAAGRYVVLNSGHTFRGKDLGTINYLLFPRWGDWAMLRIPTTLPSDPASPWETVLDAGYFDEYWQPASTE